MEDQGLDLIKSLPGLLDFPLTIFVVWTGLRIWREAKELVVRIDDRHQKTLRDIADKTDRALARVTEGMASIREEVRVFRAEVSARREENRDRDQPAEVGLAGIHRIGFHPASSELEEI